MPHLILFNKPYHCLSQFRGEPGRDSLANYLSQPDIYPAGRLDYDSEGLLLLTDDGRLQHRISHPRHKMAKYYWVQVEGLVSQDHISRLCAGVSLKDGPATALSARLIDEPTALWPRQPPIRYRASIPTTWLELCINEGRNRQVRRMTAAVELPTLRLIRHRVGDWALDSLRPGEWREAALPADWTRRNVRRRD